MGLTPAACAAGLGVGCLGGMCELEGEEPSLYGREGELRARLSHLPFPAVCAYRHRRVSPAFVHFTGELWLEARGLLPWCPRETLQHQLDFHGNNKPGSLKSWKRGSWTTSSVCGCGCYCWSCPGPSGLGPPLTTAQTRLRVDFITREAPTGSVTRTTGWLQRRSPAKVYHHPRGSCCSHTLNQWLPLLQTSVRRGH